MKLLQILFPLVLIASLGGGAMSETSMPWDGDTGGVPPAVGDAGPYSAGEWDDMHADAFGEGVVPGIGDELAVTGTSSPLSVGTGRAWVNGKYYRHTSSDTVEVPAPTGATRIDRIVLRADYAAQEVRIARLAGVEGSGEPPALTQTDGVRWEISLAQVTVTTGGAITVVSERTAADQGRLPGEIAIMYATAVTAQKQPVRDGLIYSRWYLCDGGSYNGRQTPDMRDRMPLGVGSIATSQGAAGGSATKDLAHTHDVGTLKTDTEPSHAHQVSITTGGPSSFGLYGSAGGIDLPEPGHTHQVSGYTVGSGAHDHELTGATASAGSATQDIMPPYIGVRWFMYSP